MAQLLTINEPKVTYMDKGPKTSEDWKLYYDYRRALRKILTPTEYLIFDIIIDKVEETQAGWSCSYTEISELGDGLATNTINHAIQKLEGLGLLTVDRPKNFNQKIANVYHPVKWPTPQLVNSLNCKYEEYLAAKNAAKAKKDGTRCKNNSEHAAKNAVTSLQKMQTNDTHETHNEYKTLDTNVSNGPSGPAPAQAQAIEQEDISHHKPKSSGQEIKQDVDLSSISPPPTSKSFFAYWRERYEAVQDKPRDRIAVLGELYGIVTGKKPIPGDYSQLGQLAKQQGSGYKVLQGILKMTSCDVMDDHMSYLRKVLDNDLRRGNERGKSERPYRQNGAGAKDSGKSITELWNKPDDELKEQFNRELIEYGLRPQF